MSVRKLKYSNRILVKLRVSKMQDKRAIEIHYILLKREISYATAVAIHNYNMVALM